MIRPTSKTQTNNSSAYTWDICVILVVLTGFNMISNSLYECSYRVIVWLLRSIRMTPGGFVW
jgi:hypothetical protein